AVVHAVVRQRRIGDFAAEFVASERGEEIDEAETALFRQRADGVAEDPEILVVAALVGQGRSQIFQRRRRDEDDLAQRVSGSDAEAVEQSAVSFEEKAQAFLPSGGGAG